MRELYGLAEMALIDMGDFVGGTLKYLRRHPVPRLSLAGGFAKLAKLAQGHLDLHSARSRLDQPALAGLAAGHGAPGALAAAIAGANTASQILAWRWRRLSAGRSGGRRGRQVGREVAGPEIAWR